MRTRLTVLAFSTLSVTAPAMGQEREPLLLNEAHRQIVLAEMRGMLEGVQGIIGALSKADMETVAKLSTELGMGGPKPPMELRRRLPDEFRKIGFQVHTAFDELAANARAGEDTPRLLNRLQHALSGCTACHCKFQITHADY